MRLFVGVELDDNVKTRAAAIAEALRSDLGCRVNARWIARDNLHITLWFIGEVDDARAAAIADVLRHPFTTPAFDLELCGAGAFPPHGMPRVFWVGAGAGRESLSALYDELKTRLVPLGFEAERRPYSAHLTIARVKEAERPHRRIREVVRELDADAGRCRIGAVTLFRSRLSPKGAAYEPLLRVALT